MTNEIEDSYGRQFEDPKQSQQLINIELEKLF